MNFEQAMRAMLDGKTVYNDDYPRFIYYFEGGLLLYRRRHQDKHNATVAVIADNEMQSEWHACEPVEKQEIHDIKWAAEQIRSGKFVRRKEWRDRDLKITRDYGGFLVTPNKRMSAIGFFYVTVDHLLATDWEIVE